MPKNTTLQINVNGQAAPSGRGEPSNFAAPPTPRSPRSPFLTSRFGQGAEYGEGYEPHVSSPVRALPSPPAPKSPRHKASKIFSSTKFSRSTPKVNNTDSPAPMPEGAADQVYSLHQAGKSSPDLNTASTSGQTSPQQGSPSSLLVLCNVLTCHDRKPAWLECSQG